MNDADTALQQLTTKFAVTLEKAGVIISSINEEWKNTLDYARQRLNFIYVGAELSDLVKALFNAT